MPLRITLLIAALLAITAALAGVIGAALAGIARTMPPEFSLGIGLLPSNFPQCAAAMLTGFTARWAYDWNVELMKRASITPLI